MDDWVDGWMDGWGSHSWMWASCALLSCAALLPSSSSASERAMARRVLITFDVDGTLMQSTGPRSNSLHRRAFSAAFLQVFGVEGSIDVIKVSASFGILGLLFLCLISFVFLRWTSWCCSVLCIGSSWFMLRGGFCTPRRVNFPGCGYTRGLGLGLESGLVTSMWQLSKQTKLQNWLGL